MKWNEGQLNMVKLKIKSCPFCTKKRVEVLNSHVFWVACNNSRCHVEGPTRKTENGAIKAWNKRTFSENKVYG